MKIRAFVRKPLTALACVLVVAAFFPFSASAATARDAADSVVMVVENFTGADGKAYTAWGSGFAIGKTGQPVQYIVTNDHVIEDAFQSKGEVQVYFSAAAHKSMEAEVYWRDEAKDLAVLRLPESTTERQAMVLCPMNQVDLNDSFSALGYPVSASVKNDFPKFDIGDIAVQRGGISKETRMNQTDVYLLDLQISEGNSGGPLVNSKGQVVGINSYYIQSKANQDAATVKSNYAIAIDELIRNVDQRVIPMTIADNGPNYTVYYIAGGAAVIVIAAVIILLVVLRGRKKRTPAAASAAQPAMASVYPAEPAATVRTSFVQVRGMSGYFQGKAFPVSGQLKFGRDNNSCNVVFPIDQPGISGTHCMLAPEADGVYLTDLGSSYGTFLANGTKLTPHTPVRLHPGDAFYLAGEENLFAVE